MRGMVVGEGGRSSGVLLYNICIAPYSQLYGSVHHLFLELLKYIQLDQISYNLTNKK